MQHYKLLFEYIWIVQTVYEAKYITLAGIQDKWRKRKYDEAIVLERHRLKRDRDAIFDIFGIRIECDKKNRYYIANKKELSKYNFAMWVCQTLSQGIMLSDFMRLSDRIIPEPMPSAGNFLTDIADAMNKNQWIDINYKRFENDAPKQHKLRPYFLKAYKQRWSLFGMSDNDKIYTFTLDRIEDMDLRNEQFEYDESITANKYFQNAFGIYVDEKMEPEEVIVEVTENEAEYMRTLEWHHSQEELGTEGGWVRFRFRLCLTRDFVGHIIGRTNRVRAIYPQHLVDQVKRQLQDTLSLYP